MPHSFEEGVLRALFEHIINSKVKMLSPVFKYSLKVWLTSVLLSPVLFALILYIKRQVDLPELLKSGFYLFAIYPLYVGALLLLSSVTWLAFWLSIKAIIRSGRFARVRKMAVIFTGIALTITTFMLLLPVLGMLHDGSGFINLMYANCLCISWGSWYYDLGPLIS